MAFVSMQSYCCKLAGGRYNTARDGHSLSSIQLTVSLYITSEPSAVGKKGTGVATIPPEMVTVSK